MSQVSTPTNARTGFCSAYYSGRDPAVARRLRQTIGRVTLAGTNGLRVLSILARNGDLHDIDLDPATYLDRDDDQSLIPIDWVGRQRDLGLDRVRKPGTYFGPKDAGALAEAFVGNSLDDASTHVISLHAGWLRNERQAALTRALVGKVQKIAIAFADPFDPLSGAAAITNVLALTDALQTTGTAVELVRSDISGLGFLARGLNAAAIGTSSTTRHHGLPLGKAAGQKYRERQSAPLAFVPLVSSWQRGTWLSSLAPYDGAGLTDCSCTPCDGKSLMRFARTFNGNVPLELRQAASEHDVASWSVLARRVLGAPDPVKAWAEHVASAQRVQLMLAAAYKLPVKLPESLVAWNRVQEPDGLPTSHGVYEDWDD